MSGKSLKIDGLNSIIKALSGKKHKIKVGILGSDSARGEGSSSGQKKSKGPNNAEIGAAHEFGTEKLPERSFLRVPIANDLPVRLKELGLSDKDTLKKIIETKTFLPWLKKISILAESVVLESFDSGGNGKWKQSDMRYKKNKQTLVETQQLRNSITSVVE